MASIYTSDHSAGRRAPQQGNDSDRDIVLLDNITKGKTMRVFISMRLNQILYTLVCFLPRS